MDLYSNNESLYHTNDNQNGSKELKSILKTQSELDKFRSIRKLASGIGSQSNLFSCSNKNFKSKAKKQFMNFICESDSSDTDESTNSDINSNYI